MTLVIACKSIGGIVVAADGKGILENKSDRTKDKVIEDTQKIVPVGECLILAYGDGADDYDRFFEFYAENADDYREYEGVLDYEFCAKSLPDFLRRHYGHRIKNTKRHVGLILVGSDKGVCKIQVMDSSLEMFCPHEPELGWYAGGIPDIANKKLAKIDPANKPMSTVQTAELLRQLISDTADKRPNKVNKNITLKLVSNRGIEALD